MVCWTTALVALALGSNANRALWFQVGRRNYSVGRFHALRFSAATPEQPSALQHLPWVCLGGGGFSLPGRRWMPHRSTTLCVHSGRRIFSAWFCLTSVFFCCHLALLCYSHLWFTGALQHTDSHGSARSSQQPACLSSHRSGPLEVFALPLVRACISLIAWFMVLVVLTGFSAWCSPP